MERSYLKEAVSSFQIGGVVRLSKRILIITAGVEFDRRDPALDPLYPDVRPFQGEFGIPFSTPCRRSATRGFDLMGILKPYTSIVPFVGDALVSGTIMSLIAIGGLGFIVWSDLVDHKFHVTKYQLHTKIILISTVTLITLSTVAIFFAERDASMAGMGFGTRVIASLFSGDYAAHGRIQFRRHGRDERAGLGDRHAQHVYWRGPRLHRGRRQDFDRWS